jgi:hypothetical protein
MYEVHKAQMNEECTNDSAPCANESFQYSEFLFKHDKRNQEEKKRNNKRQTPHMRGVLLSHVKPLYFWAL